MENFYSRLLACGVCPERVKMLMDYYGSEEKWGDLENYIVVLEMHLRGED